MHQIKLFSIRALNLLSFRSITSFVLFNKGLVRLKKDRIFLHKAHVYLSSRKIMFEQFAFYTCKLRFIEILCLT